MRRAGPPLGGGTHALHAASSCCRFSTRRRLFGRWMMSTCQGSDTALIMRRRCQRRTRLRGGRHPDGSRPVQSTDPLPFQATRSVWTSPAAGAHETKDASGILS